MPCTSVTAAARALRVGVAAQCATRRFERRAPGGPGQDVALLGTDRVILKIIFSRSFLHWTCVMGHGDDSGAVLTCI